MITIKNQTVILYKVIILIIISLTSCDKSDVPMEQFVNFTKIVPIIDGKIDVCWDKASDINLNNYNLGLENVKDKSDLSATFRMLWDDKGLYLLIIVNDDNKFDISKYKYDIDVPNAYESDCVELFFDADNSKNNMEGSFNSQNGDSRYEFVYSREGITGTFKSLEGMVFAQSDTPKGYIFEIAIPFETLSIKQKADYTFGFEITVNDNDSTPGKQSFYNFSNRTAISWSQKNGAEAWRNTGLFGSITLLKK